MNEDMDTGKLALPELSDERIDEIERVLFREIASERGVDDPSARSRRVRRGRIWLGASGAAAVVIVAAVLAPSMPALLGGASESATTFDGAPDVAVAPHNALPERELGGAATDVFSDSSAASEESEDPDLTAPGDEREIIATASATVRVDDAGAAAAQVGSLADEAGGYVEAMSVGNSSQPVEPYPVDGAEDAFVQNPTSSAWVTVRVPADRLTEVTAELSSLGEVTGSQIDRRDVTAEAIDLRARIDALSASVTRLTALVARAESTADLIAAEEALSTRQAELESLEQQLTYLEDQVGMSTLTVALVETAPVVQADPAGFGDGIAAGWGGLVATLNGFVIALGFLLPWIGVIVVAAVIVLLLRRLVRRRREGAGASTRGSSTGDEVG